MAESLREIRRQIKRYYDEVNSRAKDLEEPRSLWEIYEVQPSFLGWGRSITYKYIGTENRAPSGLVDEAEWTRKELKRWSKVNKEDLEND